VCLFNDKIIKAMFICVYYVDIKRFELSLEWDLTLHEHYLQNNHRKTYLFRLIQVNIHRV
jgi:hypothetical protein